MRILAAIGCLVCILVFDSDLLAQQQNAPNQNTAAQDHSDSSPSTVEKTKYGPDNYEQECNKRQERDEADLCQQWRMANAAEKQVALIADQLWFQKLEVIFLIATFLGSLVAVGVTMFVAVRQLRAYVTIEKADVVNLTGGQQPQTNIVIQNYGSTPARNVRWVAGAGLESYPLNKALRMTDEKGAGIETAREIPLAPQAKLFKHLIDADVIKPSDATGLNNKTLAYYAWGRVEYRDVFGIKRFTDYRLIIGGDNTWISTGPYGVCDKGNDAN